VILTGDALREAALEALDPYPGEDAVGPMSVDVHLDTDEPHIVESGEHWVTPARESVDMPLDRAALLTGRSSHMRQGLFMPAGWVDPGFRSTAASEFKLEFGNTSDGAALLEPGEAAGRLVFFELRDSTEGYDGRWQA
jgi:deoxycytidine triphosphate deaminase